MNTSDTHYQVNEYAPDPEVHFDRKIAAQYVKYARMLVQRGYVQSSLGGIVIRAAHPNYRDGLCYAKPQGISLEEVEEDDRGRFFALLRRWLSGISPGTP